MNQYLSDADRARMRKDIDDYNTSQQPVPAVPAKLPATAKGRSLLRIGLQDFIPGEKGHELGLPWGGPDNVQAHADSVEADLLPTITESRLGGKVSIPDSTAKYGVLKGDPSLSSEDRLEARGQYERFRGLEREIGRPSAALLDKKAEAEYAVLYGTPAEQKAGRLILKEIGKSKGLMAAPKITTPEKKFTLIEVQGKYSTVLAKLNRLQEEPVFTKLLMRSLMETPSLIKVFKERGITTPEQVDSDTRKDLVAALQNEVDYWKSQISELEYNERVTTDETTGLKTIKDLLDE